MYAEYLTKAAVSIQQSADGRDALARATAHPPDLVVTETRLPGLDGYELCALLRSDSKTRCTPIVVVTGDGYQTDIAHARAAGADTVLIKPCLPEVLLAEIHRLVSGSVDRRGANSGRRKPAMSRAGKRDDTQAPPAAPPVLVCPICDQFLVYQRSHVGEASGRQGEQWDYYACPRMRRVPYRQRTQALRRVKSGVIRLAREADLPALTDIYNHYVLHTPITFDLQPFSVEQRREWFVDHDAIGRYRLLVAEQDGEVVGYATTSRFRAKAAYDTTVESSVYCRADRVGQGIGRALYLELFAALKDEDINRIVAGITLPNAASTALHARCGFRQVGALSSVGRKFDRYWDVGWFERPLLLE